MNAHRGEHSPDAKYPSNPNYIPRSELFPPAPGHGFGFMDEKQGDGRQSDAGCPRYSSSGSVRRFIVDPPEAVVKSFSLRRAHGARFPDGEDRFPEPLYPEMRLHEAEGLTAPSRPHDRCCPALPPVLPLLIGSESGVILALEPHIGRKHT